MTRRLLYASCSRIPTIYEVLMSLSNLLTPLMFHRRPCKSFSSRRDTLVPPVAHLPTGSRCQGFGAALMTDYLDAAKPSGISTAARPRLDSMGCKKLAQSMVLHEEADDHNRHDDRPRPLPSITVERPCAECASDGSEDQGYAIENPVHASATCFADG